MPSAFPCLPGDLQRLFLMSCCHPWETLNDLTERSLYRDSKTTLSVPWDAQVNSVEGPQGQLLSRWWLAALIAFWLNHCRIPSELVTLMLVLCLLWGPIVMPLSLGLIFHVQIWHPSKSHARIHNMLFVLMLARWVARQADAPLFVGWGTAFCLVYSLIEGFLVFPLVLPLLLSWFLVHFEVGLPYSSQDQYISQV